ncbi:unnamed protein product [Litomosoides sigmodontis]|uniref:Uncharacterized protein n=1 Tax=Litomosoides sigmodontis TaxID=42156 RepID=A0A3P6T7Z8_LITSI|nr:unnamed protein product [Litomosoides sigmodontis]
MTAFNYRILTRLKKGAKRASMPIATIALSAAAAAANKKPRNGAVNAQKRWLNLYQESKIQPSNGGQ